jgi:Transposase DDE domain
MTEPHKHPHRHPKYKTAYHVKNWHEYDQSLRDRGDITLWISQNAIDAWSPPMTGKRGAQPVYADIAIETALTFRLLFHLPLRQTEGFLRSVLTLMGLTLPCPDHTTLSRRHPTVAIRQQVDRASEGPLSLIVDSNGMYDREPVYAAVRGHSPEARVMVPPRKDAVLSSRDFTAPTQRDQQLLAIEREGRFAWKRRSGYYDQAYAENAFSRFKRTFGDHLRAKREESQEREASLACQLLNRMRDLGRPQSYAVS